MPDLMPLTDVERRVYDFVEARGGVAIQEVLDAFGWGSARAAGERLEALEDKGWIKRLAKRGWQRLTILGPRSGPKPKVLCDGAKDFSLPIAGYVAAGRPIPPAVPDGERLELGRLLGACDVQLLQVRGDSMVEAAILNGDYVAVRPCARSDEGKIVVAELDGCHTLKVFRMRSGTPTLIAKNKDIPPIRLTARDDPRLVGVFIALVRLVPPKV